MVRRYNVNRHTTKIGATWTKRSIPSTIFCRSFTLKLSLVSRVRKLPQRWELALFGRLEKRIHTFLLQQNGMKTLKRSSNSPDLSPIEDLSTESKKLLHDHESEKDIFSQFRISLIESFLHSDITMDIPLLWKCRIIPLVHTAVRVNVAAMSGSFDLEKRICSRFIREFGIAGRT